MRPESRSVCPRVPVGPFAVGGLPTVYDTEAINNFFKHKAPIKIMVGVREQIKKKNLNCLPQLWSYTEINNLSPHKITLGSLD